MANAPTKFTDTMYVRAYELARSGLTNNAIAKALGVTAVTFEKWVSRRKALADALDRARQHGGPTATTSFRDYVYQRLPQHLKRLWDEINRCEEADDAAERIEALLSRAGMRARQHLFLYALVEGNFNASEACRKCNVHRKTLDTWSHDPDFRELMDEIHWHKGNFFEGALCKAVRDGEPAVIIFANRTYNRDRGYSDKVKAEVEVKQSPQELRIEDLPLDVRRALLAHLSQRQGYAVPALPAPLEDYDDVVVEERQD